MSNPVLQYLLLFFLALDLGATVYLFVKVLDPNRHLPGETVHYTVYVGTNDKDTYQQIVPTDEAKRIVDEICSKYVNGFTVLDARGTWHDEKRIPTHENTVVCYLDDIDDETLHRICREIRDALNQNAVLIQKEYTKLVFFKDTDET